MTSEQLADLLRASDGKIVTVRFIKRTNGEERTLTGRLGVKKYLRGGPAAYNFAEKGLISIYEMDNGYRCVPVESILELRAGGEVFVADR